MFIRYFEHQRSLFARLTSLTNLAFSALAPVTDLSFAPCNVVGYFGRVHDRLAAYYLAYPQACESVLE